MTMQLQSIALTKLDMELYDQGHLMVSRIFLRAQNKYLFKFKLFKNSCETIKYPQSPQSQVLRHGKILYLVILP